MFKIILYILPFVLYFQVLGAENKYPLIVNNFTEYSAGRTLIATKPNSNDVIIYQLKYDFTRGNEEIKIFSGKSGKTSQGIILNRSKVLCSMIASTNLLIILQENNGIYFAVLKPDGSLSYKTLITSEHIPADIEKCNLISIIDNNNFLLDIEGALYKININDTQKISIIFIKKIQGDLINLDNAAGFNNVEYAVTEESSTGTLINFYDNNNEFKFLTKLVSYSSRKWIDLGTKLVLLTSPDGKQTLIQAVDKNSGLIATTFWIDAGINLISLQSNSNTISASYIETGEEGYNFCKAEISMDNPKIQPLRIKLSADLINPSYLFTTANFNVLLFGNYIILIDDKFDIAASQFYPLDKKINDIEKVIKTNNNFFIISNLITIKFTIFKNDYWILKYIYSEVKNYLVLIILIILLITFIQLFRHQKRLAGELLDLPNIGLLFVVDASGRLTSLNNVAKEFLEINDSIPKRKFFRFYAKNSKSQAFADIIDTALESKDSSKQKITMMVDSAETEWLCKTIPLRNITGMFRGVVLSAVDITEQLERKRLSNWAQLAHDMQTNLSTIKLNAEHLDIESSENNKSRQKRIVYQVSLLMQRVRDIVTVGRSDTLNLETYNISDICRDVRNEFDEVMFPGVNFNIECQNFLIQCDRPKLIRAIRNAAENGIKALKGLPGTISIKASQEQKYAVIKVEDTGSGMDEEIKKKMLTPYFTTAAKSGGSGIGTMIMQHVTELHGGFLVVNSEKGRGTQVIFYIPKTLSYKKDKVLKTDE